MQAKAERLKQAKDEAAREVAAFKEELEAQYAASIDADVSENAAAVDKMRVASDAEIAKVAQSMNANKQRVLDLLLTQVKTVGSTGN
jgi:K+-transporting ATPase c subunit